MRQQEGVAEQFCKRNYRSPFPPFHLAVQNGHNEIVKMLIDLFQKNNKSFDFRDGKEQTIFRVACQAGHLDIVNFSMNNVPLDLRLLDKEDKLPCTWLVHMVMFKLPKRCLTLD